MADSQRRAAAIGDFIAARRDGIAELAEHQDLEAYLINRALGMSLQYGLNANLEAIEQRFRQKVAKKTLRGAPIYSRILYLDEHGETLADHNVFFDHHSLYETTLMVPMIYHWPGHVPARCV